MKHLLKLLDLSREEIIDILNLADQLKYEQKHGISHRVLEGKTLGMIFEKSSTRTRVSFEVGMYQLGGSALFLSKNDLQIGRGEPIQDTARVLSRYLDGIMIRTFAQKTVEDLAAYGSIPIINGLTDFSHPCQVLADLMTIREHKGTTDGLKMCFIGDGNNMAHSLIVGGLKTGMRVSIATPADYKPEKEILDFAEPTGRFQWCEDPLEAAGRCGRGIYRRLGLYGAGKRGCPAAGRPLRASQVNQELMERTNKGCMVLHCLPAHRGEEITDEVMEAHANEIFDEAENRLHAQKAVMVKLMGKQ